MQWCLTQYQRRYKVQEYLTDHTKDRKLTLGGGGHQADTRKKQKTYKSALIYSFFYALIQNMFVGKIYVLKHIFK